MTAAIPSTIEGLSLLILAEFAKTHAALATTSARLEALEHTHRLEAPGPLAPSAEKREAGGEGLDQVSTSHNPSSILSQSSLPPFAPKPSSLQRTSSSLLEEDDTVHGDAVYSVCGYGLGEEGGFNAAASPCMAFERRLIATRDNSDSSGEPSTPPPQPPPPPPSPPSRPRVASFAEAEIPGDQKDGNVVWPTLRPRPWSLRRASFKPAGCSLPSFGSSKNFSSHIPGCTVPNQDSGAIEPGGGGGGSYAPRRQSRTSERESGRLSETMHDDDELQCMLLELKAAQRSINPEQDASMRRSKLKERYQCTWPPDAPFMPYWNGLVCHTGLEPHRPRPAANLQTGLLYSHACEPCLGQLALLVCLSGIAVPLQLAFEARFTAAGTAWEVPSYMMDACFIADVYVQFRTGFMQEGTS